MSKGSHTQIQSKFLQSSSIGLWLIQEHSSESLGEVAWQQQQQQQQQQKKDPESYFFNYGDPQTYPGTNFLRHCILLFITFGLICNMPVCTWPWDQHSRGVSHIKILNILLQTSFKGYYLCQFQDSSSKIAKKAQNPTFWYLVTLDVPLQKYASLYSTLHYLRFDMLHNYVCTKWIFDNGTHPLWARPMGSHQNYE